MFTSHIVLFLSLMRPDAVAALPSHQASLPLVQQQKVAKPRVAKPKRVVDRATLAPAPIAAPSVVESAIVEPGMVEPPLFAIKMQVALAPTADEVVKKVQDFYVETKSFTATFRQTVTNQTFNKIKPKVSNGKVYILKPGKMRWDYENKSYKAAPDPKVSNSFISDGKHLWAVMHKNKQYYKEDLEGSTLPVALSFLMGTGDLTKEFSVALDKAGKYGGKDDLLLLLTPKTPSARYKKLWLVVDSSNFSVKESVVLNTKGDTNSIRFSNVKTNTNTLKAGHFIFNAKAHKDFRLTTAPTTDDPE